MDVNLNRFSIKDDLGTMMSFKEAYFLMSNLESNSCEALIVRESQVKTMEIGSVEDLVPVGIVDIFDVAKGKPLH